MTAVHKDNVTRNELEDLKDADGFKDSKSTIFIAEVENGKPVKRKIFAEENDIKGYLKPGKCQANEELDVINVGKGSKVQYGKLIFN